MNWNLFASVFALIFFAELPDKTIFATVLMATRGRPWAVFAGVAVAFVVQTLVAVTFGSLFGSLLDKWMPLIAGVLFLGFAAHAWFRNPEREEETEREEVSHHFETQSTSLSTAFRAFVVIFIAEWGDLTQLASASLTAKYKEPVTVFAASVLALWVATALAVVVGSKLSRVFEPHRLNKIVAILMAAIGAYFLVSAIRSLGTH